MEHSKSDSVTIGGLERQSQSQAAASEGGIRSEPGSKPPSCFTCRRRKVKCDKKNPCENCSKAGTACVFPTTSKRKFLPPSPELLKTLQMLEKAVKTLNPNAGQSSAGYIPQPQEPQTMIGLDQSTHMTSSSPRIGVSLPFLENINPPRIEAGELSVTSIKPFSGSGGRLIRDQGKETYLKASFWDAFNLDVVYGSPSQHSVLC